MKGNLWKWNKKPQKLSKKMYDKKFAANDEFNSKIIIILSHYYYYLIVLYQELNVKLLLNVSYNKSNRLTNSIWSYCCEKKKLFLARFESI